MSLFSAFRKPAWQSSNPARRLAAVSAGNDPDLRAALPRLALEDPDASIRREALRRCDDLALFASAMKNDGDGGIRHWARERWLAAVSDGRIEADDGVLSLLEGGELEQLAIRHGSAALRQRLLQRINRQGFINERALADPDAGIRLALVERIDTVAVLERIADKARRFDKRLARAARDRADALRLASGDNAAQARRALALCQSLEQVMREPMELDARRARLASHEEEWRSLDAEALSSELHARFAGAREVILAQLQPPPAPSPEAAGDHSPEESGPGVVEEPPPPSLEEIAAQTRLQAELAALAEQRAREKAEQEAQQKRVAERRAGQHALLQSLEKALDDGDMAAAGKSLADIDPALLAQSDQRQWQSLQPRLRELRAWQRWASQGARQRLCEDVEALEGRGLHPDALATRVRELQQQWRQIHVDGADGLDRRFHAACTRVLKPARGFFEKRDALRDGYRQTLDRFFADAHGALGAARPAGDVEGNDATSAGEIETERLLALQSDATGHLRQLDRLAPGDRREAADRLRGLLDRIRPVLESRFASVEKERDRLIEAATRLSGETDGKRLGVEARSLNQRWQALGKGRRGRDQQQWRRFRAALDQAFANLDATRRENAAAAEALHAQAEALVAAIEEAVAGSEEQAADAAARVRELRERWQAMNIRDAALGKRYDDAMTRHRLALERVKARQQREQLLALIEQAPAAGSGTDEGRVAARALVFEAESLAGIDPPDDEREARRQWQLERLQARLGGGAGVVDLAGLLARWRDLAGVDAEDRRRFGERLTRVVERSA